jgi:hypothetical protein
MLLVPWWSGNAPCVLPITVIVVAVVGSYVTVMLVPAALNVSTVDGVAAEAKPVVATPAARASASAVGIDSRCFKITHLLLRGV